MLSAKTEIPEMKDPQSLGENVVRGWHGDVAKMAGFNLEKKKKKNYNMISTKIRQK